jgi:oxysterol-binding protein-related protein 9/10/11
VLKWLLNTLKQQYCSRSEKLGSEKKPLNPFLGELFLGQWDDVNGSGTTKLVSEQVSHHPPVTAYCIRNDKHKIQLQGYNGQKATFSRTIHVKQIGHALLTLTPPSSNEVETYLISLPPLHIESLIYGTPFVELGKFIHIASSSGYIAKVDFSGRGWLSGKKNTFTATLWKDGDGSESSPLYTAEGQWSDAFTFHEGSKKGKLIDKFHPSDIKVSKLVVPPVEAQDVFESRKAWAAVAKAINKPDMDATAHYKSRIENAQRALRKKEQEGKREWKRVFFSTVAADQPEEKTFQRLVKMITSPSMGASCWDGVGADKTAGVWRYDEKKAKEAKRPWHPETGGAEALGFTEDGESAHVSRVPTAEDVPEVGAKDGKEYPTPVQSRQ